MTYSTKPISQSVRAVRLAAAAALLAVCVGSGAAPAARAQEPPTSEWPQAFGAADSRPFVPFAEPLAVAPSRSLGIDLDAVPQVALAPVDVAALLREDEIRSRRDASKVLRFGIGRAVSAAASDGIWTNLPDGGRLWALEVVSPGALGLRLHLASLALPRTARIAVYAPDRPDQVSLYDGDDPSLGGDLWTATTLGERVRLELRLPARSGVPPGRLPFALDRLQHLYLDPVRQIVGGIRWGGKAAGPCHNDVTCFPEWANVARAVGGLGTIGGGDSLFCTGELLNTSISDLTPYFLTAHHCVGTQAEAARTEVFWLYQTATCGGAPPSLSSVPRSVGATLLSTGEASDYTLLMIEGALPRGLFWAGWTAEPVANGTASADIHHPSGDFKRISFGNRSGSATQCGSEVLSDHVRIDWTDGPTEPGSSGSGIYRSDTQQLYAQLDCGPSACGNETYDVFGSFAVTYGKIASFLAGGSDDTFEDNETCPGARGASPGTYKNLIVKSVDPDWYRLKIGAGKTLTVTLSLNRSWGNLGIRAYIGCVNNAAAVSTTSGNTETLTLTNHGAADVMVRWQVFLRNDTRNSYSMTVAVK
jgi:hypothetical protein